MPNLATIRERICALDGRLIRLDRLSPQGEELNLSVRRASFTEPYSEGLFKKALRIDAFADISPVGHADWEIILGRKDNFPSFYAISRNMRRYVRGGDDLQIRADKFWDGQKTRYQAFDIHHRYRGLGIEALLIAASAITLSQMDVPYALIISQSDQCKKAWEGFGIDSCRVDSPDKSATFGLFGTESWVDVAKLLDRPEIDISIQRFLDQQTASASN
jgi:hypothetical protein